jgi:hypothetical protein
VIADTGTWLPKRQVLISPYAFGSLQQAEKVLRVNLTRKQIEDSPAIESHQPVSRQYEEEYHRYYGWPDYWQGGGIWGVNNFPILTMPPKTTPVKLALGIDPQHKRADAHLQSAQAVIGYHIKASDEITGHVCDFLMDDQSWAIQQLVVKTGHRFTGKEVLIPVGKVERISYDDSTVFVNLTREAVEKSPEHRLVPVVVPVHEEAVLF